MHRGAHVVHPGFSPSSFVPLWDTDDSHPLAQTPQTWPAAFRPGYTSNLKIHTWYTATQIAQKHHTGECASQKLKRLSLALPSSAAKETNQPDRDDVCTEGKGVGANGNGVNPTCPTSSNLSGRGTLEAARLYLSRGTPPPSRNFAIASSLIWTCM